MTTEEFIQKARAVHGDRYDYSKVEYVNNRTKIAIICPKHGEFWQRPSEHLCGSGCPECSREKVAKLRIGSKELFIEKAKQVHGEKYDYSIAEYVNNRTKICILCPKHGEFWQYPYSHLNGHGCSKCAYESARNSNIYTQEVIIQRLLSRFGNRYSYEQVKYKNMKTPIMLFCHVKDANGVEHGLFSMRPDNIFSSNQECPKCANINRSILHRKSKETFIAEATKVHGAIYKYHKTNYINGRVKVCIICPIHGEFWQTPEGHLQGKGCPWCAGNARKWNKESCEQEARKYEYIFDFNVRASAAYNKARINGWLQDYTWLKKLPPKNLDYVKDEKYIYAYEFVEQNAVYVGLTNSLIKRDWQHRHSKDSSVFHFAKDFGCKIPNPKILEAGVPLYQSGKREAFWVEHYKKLNWHLLNKAKTGERESSIGTSFPLKWNKKTIREKAKECGYDLRLFIELYSGAYQAILVRYKGLLNELFPNREIHMQHTLEDALIIVKNGNFKNRTQLKHECSWAYMKLFDNNLLDVIFGKPKEYTREQALKESKNYSSIKQIRSRNYHLFTYLKKYNLLEEIRQSFPKSNKTISINEAWDISMQYSCISDLYSHASVAYRILKNAGLLPKRYPNSLRKVVLQFSTDGEFIKEWPNAYRAEQQLKICGVGHVCKGRQKTAGGYIWKYKE